MADGVITTGSTPTFELDADKDDAPWDFDSPSQATISLYLTDPGGTEDVYTPANVVDGPGGRAQYAVAETVLDQVGTWYRQWKVEQGGLVFWSPKKAFFVEDGG